MPKIFSIASPRNYKENCFVLCCFMSSVTTFRSASFFVQKIFLRSIFFFYEKHVSCFQQAFVLRQVTEHKNGTQSSEITSKKKLKAHSRVTNCDLNNEYSYLLRLKARSASFASTNIPTKPE